MSKSVATEIGSGSGSGSGESLHVRLSLVLSAIRGVAVIVLQFYCF